MKDDDIASASASEQKLRSRIEDGGFAVALSGGGHRATLATLGCLLALIDRGLGSKIIQIASVSGGSITNAFVAQRARLERLGPGGLDAIATELASTIIQRGVLTRGWIALLILTPIVAGIATGAACFLLLQLHEWLSILVGVATAFSLLLFRGLAVEWLLECRYFGRIPSDKKGRERARMSSLSGRKLEHVFCMTDLALGLPVYASTEHAGMIWRVLHHEPAGIAQKYRPFQTFQCDLSIAEVVRASAAFPGIPPRKIPIPSDPQNDLVAETPDVAFLADGGLWNNLGTQALREDGIIGCYSAWDNGVLRPYNCSPHMPLLCFNGSAPLSPTKHFFFSIPGLALAQSLLQIMEILNANTVMPRVQSMKRALKSQRSRGTRPDCLDPADLIVDLRPVEEIKQDYWKGTWTRELIQKTDLAVKNWEKDALSRIRLARENLDEKSKTDLLTYILGGDEPEGSFPAVGGFADVNDWLKLINSETWRNLVNRYGTTEVGAPTTLGKIEQPKARMLIARGYLNTYLVSLFLEPLTDQQLNDLANLSNRLDRIVGINPASIANEPCNTEST